METRNWTKELRLGNSIRLYLGVSDLGAEYREATILGIQDDYGTIRIRIDQTDTWHHTSNFEAVSLTEEWFLKFGFQFDTIDWQFPNNSVYFIGWYAGKWCLGTQSDGVLKETYFEFVHQLQNLYFALTGEELEINLTTQ